MDYSVSKRAADFDQTADVDWEMESMQDLSEESFLHTVAVVEPNNSVMENDILATDTLGTDMLGIDALENSVERVICLETYLERDLDHPS